MKNWEILKRKLIFDGSPFLSLYKERIRLENGSVIDDFYTIDQRDFVVIFALLNPDSILAIRHYKHGAKRINLGLPAGYVENDEEPLLAAQRELLEETGYSANAWTSLSSYVVDGNRGCGNVHVFFATGVTRVTDPDPDDLETINVEIIPVTALPGLLSNGEIATLGAAIGVTSGLLKIKSEYKRD